LILSPADLGLPPRFAEWRPGQDAGFEHLLHSSRRISGIAVGTGVGKSAIGVAYQRAMGVRAVYVVSTRGLQDQLLRDFGPLGITDVRGMSNYECLDDGGFCHDAPCLDGGFCDLRDRGCLYFDAIRRGNRAPLVVTNYAWWLHSKDKFPNLGARELLILDEAHAAPEALASYCRVELTPDDWHLPPHADRLTPTQWALWAVEELEKVKEQKQYVVSRGTRHRLRVTGDKLTRLSQAGEHWLVQPEGRGFKFEPLWPHEQAEEILFRGVPRVVLLSATMRRETLAQLGLQPPQFDFFEGTSPLPLARRPIYHIPTARLSDRTSDEVWSLWVSRIDQILEARKDRKGLIHVPSYRLAKFLRANSRCGDRLIVPESETSRDEIRRFQEARGPHVLASPAIRTGWDFAGCQAEFQVIGKVPWTPPSPIINARDAALPGYSQGLAVAEIVQASGRCMRAIDDACETFILDSHIEWLVKKYASLFPRWWHQAFRTVPVNGAGVPLLPAPPPRLHDCP
jgi:ATP-dependent DNA helicase DinG